MVCSTFVQSLLLGAHLRDWSVAGEIALRGIKSFSKPMGDVSPFTERGMVIVTDQRAVPFLRWAGGKSWLVRRVRELFGELKFEKYHEPFLGGGAVFFGLDTRAPSFLSDANAELIETYQAVAEDVERVIAALGGYENSAAAYYAIRAETPNCRFQRAARFIYLNQTSFNGIYRVNLKGVYNVPYGARTKPFLDAMTLRTASQALAIATLSAQDFDHSLDRIEAGDLVFVDPPYTVSHNFNGFIKYNQSLFSLADQHRLADFIRGVRAKRARYILTNAAHSVIEDIFDMGDRHIEVSRASLIGGKKAERGHVSEYIFTNVEPVNDDYPQRREFLGSDGRSRRSARSASGEIETF